MYFARALLCLLLGSLSTLAAAGATVFLPANVNAAGYAWGTVRDVRNTSAQGTQDSIGCSVGGGSGPLGHNQIRCHASDAALRVECTVDATALPGYKQVVQSISSSSHVYFAFDPATEVCIDILVVNGSRMLELPTRYNSTAAAVHFTSPGPANVFGTLTGARAAPNTTEYIECGSWASGYTYCTAVDAAGRTLTCDTNATDDPLFVERVRSIDSASHVLFGKNPTTGACSGITLEKSSGYLP
jgi:hypothetical protein